MNEQEKDWPALFKAEEFFKLPIAAFNEFGITPLVGRDQPTGFFDENSMVWVAWLTGDEGLKRKQL